MRVVAGKEIENKIETMMLSESIVCFRDVYISAQCIPEKYNGARKGQRKELTLNKAREQLPYKNRLTH